MDIPALERFLADNFPQAEALGFQMTALDEEHIALSLTTSAAHLRPGGTVSGPVMMTMADTAAYLIILAHLGPVALAVTTNLNIHFVRKPAPGPLHVTARLLKLGKRIAVAEVRLGGEQADALCAHATVTYSIPPQR
ncbi:MAG: PaaI family thioesterase [Deltaproteobacteria bacterium]|nr:PaaI family thioesterase [Deltaproteobacteria bacterium]